MANIDKLIPHIIRWEAGVKQLYGESLERLFERARRPGYAYDPDDKGGHTQTGITLNTYIRFRKFAGRSKPVLKDLKNITQKVLKVAQDGIFGIKTLGAINKWPEGPEDLWKELKKARIAYYTRIATGKQKKFLRGWLNRVNSLEYKD